MSKEDLLGLIKLLSAIESTISMCGDRNKIPDYIWEHIEIYSEKLQKEIFK